MSLRTANPGAGVELRTETAPKIKGERGLTTATHVILIVWSVITGLPILWVLMSSVKTDSEIFVDSWRPPAALQFDNYARAWNEAQFGNYFLNSLIVVGLSTVIVMIIGAMVSYVLARYQFVGRRVLNLAFVGAMALPVFLAVIPLFGVMKQLGASMQAAGLPFGVLGTYHGLIAVYVAYAMPFTVFFLTGFFASLPNELSEAAFIDGCGHFKTYFFVMLPLARPGIVSITIFNAVGLWNQYLLPLFLNNDNPGLYVVTQGLAKLAGDSQYGSDFSGLFAGLVISMAPVLILYVIFQKQIQAGMTAGALK